MKRNVLLLPLLIFLLIAAALLWQLARNAQGDDPTNLESARGEGKFKRISWDEATAFIAAELTRVSEQYGREAIYYNYQSGA
ncbi:molybdopterin-dependent oxidoreductase, partial [Salmonella enterica subsp. enterica serovar Kentucky]|nr:molybdopterin-dependent oxidoreductase [Salmonella enterica subsp. enterica serovar Kentucky]